jgi:hypothetical protein
VLVIVGGCTAPAERPQPTTVVVPTRQETLIAGREFNCQLTSRGVKRCWGRPIERRFHALWGVQLAIGSTAVDVSKVEPMCALDEEGEVRCDVGGAPEIGRATQVAVNSEYGCAVLIDGDQVACWRLIGDEVTFYSVPQALTVAVNREHACALTRRGPVICWGFGADCPPQWISSFSVGVDISARVDTCVVDQGGAVRCMPSTSCPTNFTSELTPVATVERAVRVATGYFVNCATDGTSVGCWPASEWGLDPEPLRLTEPVEFASDTKIVELVVGERHACVRRADGTVECWGSNNHHQLDATIRVDTPRVVAGLEPVDQVIVGWDRTCARETEGGVLCWGDTGNPGIPWSGIPTSSSTFENLDLSVFGHLSVAPGWQPILSFWPDVRDLHAEGSRVEWTDFDDDKRLACGVSPVRPTTCGIWALDTNTIAIRRQVLAQVRELALCGDQAWLVDSEGSVSFARPVNRADIFEHVRDVSLPAGAAEIACRGLDACARLEDGAVACWSDSSMVQGLYEETPMVIPLERPAVELAMGVRSACARSEDGQVECWGDRRAPSLGFASSQSRVEVPRALSGVDDAVQVAIDFVHGCVVHADGKVSCWGQNNVGQVGFGFGGWNSEPVENPPP